MGYLRFLIKAARIQMATMGRAEGQVFHLLIACFGGFAHLRERGGRSRFRALSHGLGAVFRHNLCAQTDAHGDRDASHTKHPTHAYRFIW